MSSLSAHRTSNFAERGFQCHINSSKTRTDSPFAFPFFPLNIRVRALLGVYSVSRQLDKDLLRDMERSVFSGRSGTMDVYIGAYMVRSMLLSAFVSVSQGIPSLKYFYMVISRSLVSDVRNIKIVTCRPVYFAFLFLGVHLVLAEKTNDLALCHCCRSHVRDCDS